MKMLSLIISFLFISSAKSQQFNFVVKAKFTQLPPGKHRVDFKLVVTPQKDTLFFTDSIYQEKETITISGYLNAETLATLSIKRVGVFDFGLAPGDTIFLTLPAKKFIDSFSVSGSNRTVSMVNYIYKTFRQQSSDMRARKAKMDSLVLNLASQDIIGKHKHSYDSTYEANFHYNVGFADSVNSATAVFYALYPYLGESGRFNVFPYIEKSLLKFGNTAIIESLKLGYNSRINKSSNTSFNVGDIMPLDQIFDNVLLKKIDGIFSESKLVLVDFWASWCGPCRTEFPFLNEIYKEFKSKKFDIVSISFDQKKQDWEKALLILSPLWKNHYIDTSAWESQTVKILRITSIPRNYLIDRNGKIYAKDLHGAALKDAVLKLL